MRSLRFVTAHRGDEASFRNTPLYKSLAGRYDLYARLNNAEGLSKVYNRYLDEEFDAFEQYLVDGGHQSDDIVVFLHDDLELIAHEPESELNRWVAEGFSLLGLAGSKNVLIKAPSFWGRMTPSGAHSGASIFHFPRQEPGEPPQRDLVYPTFFGVLGEVVLLDGLLIAAPLDVIRGAGWRWDEDFDFHHYDLASSIRAHEKGLRLRTVFVPVVHWSHGLRHGNAQFFESEAKFLKKFGGATYRV